MAAEARQSELPSVVPMIAYEDCVAAIAWLSTAFGFVERVGRRSVAPDGRVTHAELEAGDGVVMLATPSPDYQGPRRHRQECDTADRWLEVPWIVDGVLVRVPDLDVLIDRARAAGAAFLSGIEDAPFGRLCRVEDIEGHRWMFVEVRRDRLREGNARRSTRYPL